jgi:PKD domain-containing protein
VRIVLLALAMSLTLSGSALAAPEPSFTVSPDPPVAGQPATFISTSTPAGLPPGTRVVEWDITGDKKFDVSGEVVTHTYASAGDKTLRMRVSDRHGGKATRSFTITVVAAPVGLNDAPVAQFRLSPSAPLLRQQIVFQSLSYDPDGSIASYEWDFDGDGFDDGNGAQVAHAFTSTGDKVVRLRVSDNSGASSVAVHTFPVSPLLANRLPMTSARLMYPFPVIRLAGSVTARGARVRILEVRAPSSSQITVRCAGKTCPAERIAKESATRRVRFERMARFLAAGTVITVAVRKRNLIGKHTRWLIRGGMLPKRKDRCLYPGRSKPARCPVS